MSILRLNKISLLSESPKKLTILLRSLKMDVLHQLPNLPWCKPDWCFPSMSKETNELLHQCRNITPSNVAGDVDDIVKRSGEFPIPFPIETVRMHKLKERVPKEILKRNIESTYPFIHERVLLLITHFLIYKREFGSSIEKALYNNMSVPDFIDRILRKRAIVFMSKHDHYKLITGEEGQEGWESVGTLQQRPPLTLENCLSYDEMKISSLIYVSGRTHFINDGARQNAGVEQDGRTKDGVIIGLIGPRLERQFRMEHEDLLITEQQNTLENGYGEEVTPTTCLNVLRTTYVRNNQSAKNMWRQLWSEFYQVQSYTYDELSSYINSESPNEKQKYTDRYIRLGSDIIFDNEIYYKRLAICFDSALLEANERAKEDGTTAFLNVIGIGLGVWKISDHQNDVFVLTLLERLRYLLRKDLLRHVSDVNLAYIKVTESIEELFKNDTDAPSSKKIFFESKRHPKGGINVQLENREPSSTLPPQHSGKLLVVTYPWDGNAHPGNEFWLGSLTGSGDPAAACSTQVSELHNAHINAGLVGSNLRVVGSKGVLNLAQYCQLLNI